MNALHRCSQLRERIKSVSEGLDIPEQAFMPGEKKYLREGTVALMNDKNIQPDTLKEGNVPTPVTEIEQLRVQMQDI